MRDTFGRCGSDYLDSPSEEYEAEDRNTFKPHNKYIIFKLAVFQKTSACPELEVDAKQKCVIELT